MASASPARQVALDALGRQRRRDAYSRDLLRRSRGMSALGPRSRALASRLVLGTVATSGELDRVLDSHLRHPSRVEPRVRDALRLSAFETLYLETPAAAAVSQGVELVRGVAPRAAGMANAVLRRIADEDRPELDRARSSVRSGRADGRAMATVAGVPEWLVDELVDACGRQAACEVVLSQLEPAPIYVAANASLHTPEKAREQLEAAGLEPVGASLPGSFSLARAAGLAGSGLVEDVDVVICDLAAQLVSRIAAPAPGSAMLEVGQGRATKTFLLEGAALAAGAPARIAAVDSIPHKVRIATERVSHGWADYVEELVFDARNLSDAANLPNSLDREFDTVLVDAPCSGTGTMRRHPEIPWSLEASSLDATVRGSLPALQLEILSAAASRVAVGGALVYATCSLLAEENEGVVEAFLADAPEFGLVPVTDAPGVAGLPSDALDVLGGCVTDGGLFRSHPALASFDGHFCARFVRS